MIETTLKRDRLVAVAALVLVTLLAWAWTLWAVFASAGMPMDEAIAGMSGDTALGGAVSGMSGETATNGIMSGMAAPAAWSGRHALFMFAMWWIMMVAMMLPSAAPFVLLGVSLQRRRGGDGATALWMTAGYLGVWGLSSAAATLAQWGLDAAGWLSGASMRTGPVAAGVILLAAGAYQLTSAKRACLRHCRSPVRFLVEHWRPGAAGALRTGVAHGTFCVGCCWMLMVVLFAVGVMNPFWIGALALWILVEKRAPYGERLRYAAGALLMLAGALILLRPL